MELNLNNTLGGPNLPPKKVNNNRTNGTKIFLEASLGTKVDEIDVKFFKEEKEHLNHVTYN